MNKSHYFDLKNLLLLCAPLLLGYPAYNKEQKQFFTLGGRDCGSVVIWDITIGQVLCGAHASRGVQGQATTLLPMMRRGQCFVTAGDNHLSVWTIDVAARSVRSIDVAMSKLRRDAICLDGNERDEVYWRC